MESMRSRSPSQGRTHNFVKRPGYCSGKPMRVATNHLQLTSLPQGKILHYDVIGTLSLTLVDLPPKKHLLAKVWDGFVQNNSGIASGCLFDGVKNLYSQVPLTQLKFVVALPPDLDVPEHRRKEKSVNLEFKQVAEIDMNEVQKYASGSIPINNNVLTGITVLDVLMRTVHSRKTLTIGSKFFNSEQNGSELVGGIDAWVGLYMSIRPGNGFMSLNVNVCHTAFYHPSPVLKYLGEVFRTQNYATIARENPKDVIRYLGRKKVTTTHRRGFKKVLTIFKLGESAQKQKFQKKERDGDNDVFKEISVAEYFQSTYNVQLKYPDLPVANVGNKERPNYVPLEFLILVPGQKVQGLLSDEQTTKMLQVAAARPQDHKRKIEDQLRGLDLNTDFFKKFNLKIDQKFIELDAKMINQPTLMFKDSEGISFAPQRTKFHIGSEIGTIAVINFNADGRFPMRDSDASRVVDSLMQELSHRGLSIHNDVHSSSNYRIYPASPHNYGDAERNMCDAYADMVEKYGREPSLFLIILPNRGPGLYAQVKRICYTKLGVPSQCLLSQKLSKSQRGYFTNLSLKVNLKLYQDIEPVNWGLKLNTNWFDEACMIMGADVYHPPPGSSEASIAAVVASVNPSCSFYVTAVRAQDSRRESIEDMEGMTTELLQNFFKRRGFYPSRILFYRDGVSEGQFQMVKDTEITKLEEVANQMSGKKIQITYVVVQKRHHTRFFPLRNEDTDRSGNISSGLVVEKGITTPNDFDFFLQSQNGLKGTSKPSYYRVIRDDYKFSADDLINLTNGLCRIYARSFCPVRVVAPVYYADQVCFRSKYRFSDRDTYSVSSGGQQIDTVMKELKKGLGETMYFV